MPPSKQPVNIDDRIIAVRMHDESNPVPPGTMGTVTGMMKFVGQWMIDVLWDDGQNLPLIWPGDRFIIEVPPEDSEFASDSLMGELA